MTIAVDFDGTIVEHKYPQIGREIPFAFVTLKKMQADRHRLILWTVREGDQLQEAVDFCRERGLEFYAVNSNFPEEEAGACQAPCRKVNADMYIDDRNVGALPDWGVIYEMVRHKWSYDKYMMELHGREGNKDSRSFWKRFFRR
ncbi:MAG: hypothetical protein NC206_02940 [Bacteroides sp.]|nr:hypothetical protein [Roseburia sp.]MCM1346020.1 hypothetical protein [Bacteroides sp.]MCM1421486.1 hypothetical protein [Bacteroides sp.]